MSQLNARFVKQGYWIDHSRGPILGKTLTTTTKTGNFVVAIVAIVTTLGISHLWNLVVFGYHQRRVNARPTDGLLRQQQAFLRTLPPPGSALTGSLKIWWAWRRRANRASCRSFLIVTLALLFVIATIVVGIFSSYLVDSSSITVLVSSPLCGPIDYGRGLNDTSSERGEYWSFMDDYVDKIAALATSYTRDCYTNSSTPERCKIFTQPTIPFQQTRTSCPFDASMCKNMSQPGLDIDTGLLDISEHLGLNLAARDRMKLRRSTQCAIIDLNDRLDIRDTSNFSRSDFERLYGRKMYAEEHVTRVMLGESMRDNATFQIAAMPQDVQRSMQTYASFYYSTPYFNNAGGSFFPIPQIDRSNSDIFVAYFIPHSTRFLGPMNDPLFSAQKSIEEIESDNKTHTIFLADAPVSAFGCQYKYQFCFAQPTGPNKCTDLQSLQKPTSLPGANELQSALTTLIVQSMFWFGPGGAVDGLVPSALNNGFNPPLPSDQWLREILFLNNHLQSQLQIGLAMYAIGPSTLGLTGKTQFRESATDVERSVCGLQLMQSPGGFVNINVFAMSFVLAFCGVVFLLDLVLLRFLVFWHKVRGLSPQRIGAWIQDGTLQLQRRAYEVHGQGTWERLDKEVPLTMVNVELGELPLVSAPLVVRPPQDAQGVTPKEKGSPTAVHTERMPSVQVTVPPPNAITQSIPNAQPPFSGDPTLPILQAMTNTAIRNIRPQSKGANG